jgi:hypothetical protein
VGTTLTFGEKLVIYHSGNKNDLIQVPVQKMVSWFYQVG